MYEIKLERLDLINTLLSISDFDYVDTVFTPTDVSFIISYNGVFAHLILPCSSTLDAGEDYARIPRKAFTNLIQPGIIQFNTNAPNGNVTIDFIDKEFKKYCSISFVKQVVQLHSYKDKLALMKSYKYEGVKVDLKSLLPFYKINRNIKSNITVSENFTSIDLTDGKMFSKHEKTGYFTLSHYACSLLLKCSVVGYNIENYIVASKGTLTVIATKNRKEDALDYNDFLEEKAKLKCIIDFTNIRYFVHKIKCTSDYITLQLDSDTCLIEQDGVSYRLPVSISELQVASALKDYEVKIPISVIREVLNNVDPKSVKLFRKKTFTQLVVEGLVVVFS